MNYELNTSRLIEAFEAVEKSGDGMMIDQAAFLLGLVPTNERTREEVIGENTPKIKALLREMKEADTRTEAMLALADYRNREDPLGRVAELLIKRFAS